MYPSHGSSLMRWVTSSRVPLHWGGQEDEFEEGWEGREGAGEVGTAGSPCCTRGVGTNCVLVAGISTPPPRTPSSSSATS